MGNVDGASGTRGAQRPRQYDATFEDRMEKAEKMRDSILSSVANALVRRATKGLSADSKEKVKIMKHLIKDQLDTPGTQNRLLEAYKRDQARGDPLFTETRGVVTGALAKKLGDKVAGWVGTELILGSPAAGFATVLFGANLIPAAIQDIPVHGKRLADVLGISLDDSGNLKINFRGKVYKPEEDPKSVWVEMQKDAARAVSPYLREGAEWVGEKVRVKKGQGLRQRR